MSKKIDVCLTTEAHTWITIEVPDDFEENEASISNHIIEHDLEIGRWGEGDEWQVDSWEGYEA